MCKSYISTPKRDSTEREEEKETPCTRVSSSPEVTSFGQAADMKMLSRGNKP